MQLYNYNYSKGKIGLKALYYYIATTTIGIITSVILVQTIQPGKILSDTSAGQRNEKPQHHVTMDVVLDLFRYTYIAYSRKKPTSHIIQAYYDIYSCQAHFCRNLIPENMISAFVEQVGMDGVEYIIIFIQVQ